MTEPAAGTRAMCKYPGCENPPAPATKPGRPPGFCELEEHNELPRGTSASAWTPRPAAIWSTRPSRRSPSRTR